MLYIGCMFDICKLKFRDNGKEEERWYYVKNRNKKIGNFQC